MGLNECKECEMADTAFEEAILEIREVNKNTHSFFFC